MVAVAGNGAMAARAAVSIPRRRHGRSPIRSAARDHSRRCHQCAAHGRNSAPNRRGPARVSAAWKFRAPAWTASHGRSFGGSFDRAGRMGRGTGCAAKPQDRRSRRRKWSIPHCSHSGGARRLRAGRGRKLPAHCSGSNGHHRTPGCRHHVAGRLGHPVCAPHDYVARHCAAGAGHDHHSPGSGARRTPLQQGSARARRWQHSGSPVVFPPGCGSRSGASRLGARRHLRCFRARQTEDPRYRRRPPGGAPLVRACPTTGRDRGRASVTATGSAVVSLVPSPTAGGRHGSRPDLTRIAMPAMSRGVPQRTVCTWCRLRDLNPRPTVYKTAALPLS